MAHLSYDLLIAINFSGPGSPVQFRETYENASTEEISSDRGKESARYPYETIPQGKRKDHSGNICLGVLTDPQLEDSKTLPDFGLNYARS